MVPAPAAARAAQPPEALRLPRDLAEVPEPCVKAPEFGVLDTARTQRWLRSRGLQARKVPLDLEATVCALYDALDLRGDGLVEARLLRSMLLVLRDDFLAGELGQQGREMRQLLGQVVADVGYLAGPACHVRRDAFVYLLLPLAVRHPDFLEALPFRAAAQTVICRFELGRALRRGDRGRASGRASARARGECWRSEAEEGPEAEAAEEPCGAPAAPAPRRGAAWSRPDSPSPGPEAAPTPALGSRPASRPGSPAAGGRLSPGAQRHGAQPEPGGASPAGAGAPQGQGAAGSSAAWCARNRVVGFEVSRVTSGKVWHEGAPEGRAAVGRANSRASVFGHSASMPQLSPCGGSSSGGSGSGSGGGCGSSSCLKGPGCCREPAESPVRLPAVNAATGAFGRTKPGTPVARRLPAVSLDSFSGTSATEAGCMEPISATPELEGEGREERRSPGAVRVSSVSSRGSAVSVARGRPRSISRALRGGRPWVF